MFIILYNINFSITGASCRTRVTKQLSKRFKTLSEAETAFDIDYVKSEVLNNDTVKSCCLNSAAHEHTDDLLQCSCGTNEHNSDDITESVCGDIANNFLSII